jgi:hypothetical protein
MKSFQTPNSHIHTHMLSTFTECKLCIEIEDCLLVHDLLSTYTSIQRRKNIFLGINANNGYRKQRNFAAYDRKYFFNIRMALRFE